MDRRLKKKKENITCAHVDMETTEDGMFSKQDRSDLVTSCSFEGKSKNITITRSDGNETEQSKSEALETEMNLRAHCVGTGHRNLYLSVNTKHKGVASYCKY